MRPRLLPNADSLVDKSTPMAMVTNFNLLQQPLLDLGVDFSSKVANAIMTRKKNVATNLCYQLKLGLENCVQSGSAPVHRRGMKDPVLLASTIKPNRAPLQRFEAMQSEHFESLVRQAAKSEKELAEALSLSRYTEFMVEATRRADELDSLTHEQHKAHVSQRRQLQLQKMSEGRRLVGEWQAEGYAKHRANMGRRKATEQAALRFELTQRERKLGRELGATKKAAGEFTSGVDEFRRRSAARLRRRRRRRRRRAARAAAGGWTRRRRTTCRGWRGRCPTRARWSTRRRTTWRSCGGGGRRSRRRGRSARCAAAA